MRNWGLLCLITVVCSNAPCIAQAQLVPAGRAGLTSIDFVFLDRELTLNDDTVEVGGRLQTLQLDAGVFSTSITGIAASLGYGAGDVLEIWAEPVLLLEPDAELGLNLGASVRAIDGQSVDMAPSVVVPLSITNDDADTLPYFGFGLDTRFKLGSMVSLFVLQDLVTVALAVDNVFLAANLGVGIQPVKIFGIRLETRPFLMETDEGEVIHYGDAVPFGFDLLLTLRGIDFFFGMEFPDLENAGDFYVVSFGAMGRW